MSESGSEGDLVGMIHAGGSGVLLGSFIGYYSDPMHGIVLGGIILLFTELLNIYDS